MYPNPGTASSWEDLRAQIEPIVAALNAAPDLALAAAANPFLALEELGIEVAPEARPEIEDRLRFSTAQAARRQELRAEIYKAAGGPFEIADAGALYRVLHRELELSLTPDSAGCVPPFPRTDPLPTRPGAPEGDPRPDDPLVPLAGKHPIVEPLLEYRRLDAQVARFAPEAAFEAIRQGEAETGIQSLRFRFKSPDARGGRRRASGGGGGRSSGSARRASGGLDINAAPAKEWEALSGVGPALAKRIVAYRHENGPFDSPEALLGVRGVGKRLLDRIRPRLS